MTKSIFGALLLCLGLFGCEKSEQQSTYVVPAPAPVAPKVEQPATDVPPIGGGPVVPEATAYLSIEGAADRVAEAQCNTQLRCAANKAFDLSKCLNDSRQMSGKGLSYEACPKGVEASKLASCLDAVHGGSCKDMLSSITAIQPCMSDSLCAK